MTLQEIFDFVTQEQYEAKKLYDENSRFLFNAKSDGAEYKELDQYRQNLELRARWDTFREIKEMLAEVLDPKLEENNKEFTKITGIKV